MDRPPNAWRPGPDWRREHWGDPEAVLRALGVGPGSSLADFGCGEGFFALAAAELVSPAPVYAVDADGTSLDELDAMAVERGLENVTTVSGDPREASAFLPAPVDVALAAGTLGALVAPTAFAEQVSRSLSPGGRFVVAEWRELPPVEEGPDEGGRRDGQREEEDGRVPTRGRLLTPEETRGAVAPAGFTVAREVDLTPHHFGVVFRRRHDA